MKLLVIGVDGASPLLIKKWIDELPTFKRIKTDGYFGLSIPPIPAQTPVAWTTFLTGKNPGKHGIFSFMMREKGTYTRKMAQPTIIQSKTLSYFLNQRGKKVGIINVPMSDVGQFNGFVIPGFLSRTEGIPYPKYFKNLITQEFGITSLAGDIETEILQNVERAPVKFFKRANQITDDTARISHLLAQKADWDFFMTVFMGADRIQHFFWKNIDPNHPKYQNNQFTEMVKTFYMKLDRIVKSFLDLADKETLTMVLSDHGFCPVHREVFINNYLKECDFLEVKNNKVDLKNSQAISYGYGDIWLNVKNREPHGIIKPGEEYEKTRDAIIQNLKIIRINGETPFKDVRRREEIYWGENLSSGPDLLAILNPGWQAARHPEIITKQGSKYVNERPRWSGGHDGTHDPDDVPGIFGLIGKDVEPKNQRVRLRDLGPTILNLMNAPIPPDMDGKLILL